MEKARIVAAELGGSATLVEIEGGSHAANLSHPGQVNTAIAEFLSGLP